MKARTITLLKGEGNRSITTLSEEHEVHLFAIELSKVQDYVIHISDGEKATAYHKGIGMKALP